MQPFIKLVCLVTDITNMKNIKIIMIILDSNNEHIIYRNGDVTKKYNIV